MQTIEQIVKCICRPPRHVYEVERLGSRDFDLDIDLNLALQIASAPNGQRNSRRDSQHSIAAADSEDSIASGLKHTESHEGENPGCRISKRCKKNKEKQRVNVVRYDGAAANANGEKICYSVYVNSGAVIPELYVMFLHSNNGSRIEALPYARSLLQARYNVCILDFAGSGCSGGDKISLGPNEMKDVEAVAVEIRRCYGLRRQVLWGKSMGACAALMYAHSFPERVKCMILDSPFKDLRKLIREIGVERTGMPQLLLEPILSIVDGKLKKESLGFGFEKYKMKQYLGNLQDIPAMFVVSWEDKLVKPHHGRKLYDRYPCSRKKLLEISGEHNSVRDHTMITKCIRFINEAILNNYALINCPSPQVGFTRKQSIQNQTNNSPSESPILPKNFLDSHSLSGQSKVQKSSFKRQNSLMTGNEIQLKMVEELEEHSRNSELMRSSDGGLLTRISLKKHCHNDHLKNDSKFFETSFDIRERPVRQKNPDLARLQSPSLRHTNPGLPTERLFEEDGRSSSPQAKQPQSVGDEKFGLSKSDEIDIRRLRRKEPTPPVEVSHCANFSKVKENPENILDKWKEKDRIFDFSNNEQLRKNPKVELSKAYHHKHPKNESTHKTHYGSREKGHRNHHGQPESWIDTKNDERAKKCENWGSMKDDFFWLKNYSPKMEQEPVAENTPEPSRKQIQGLCQVAFLSKHRREGSIIMDEGAPLYNSHKSPGYRPLSYQSSEVSLQSSHNKLDISTALKSLHEPGQSQSGSPKAEIPGIKIIGIKNTNNFLMASLKEKGKRIELAK